MSDPKDHGYIKSKELESILDGITENLIVITPDYHIKRTNRSTLEFSQKKEFKEVVGHKCFETIYHRNDICPYCPFPKKEEGIADFSILQKGKNKKSPVREILFRSETKTKTLYIDFFPIESDGEIYSIVEKISDISEIKEKEEESLRIRNLASLGILISGVAHELNNPLTGISLTLQNIQSSLHTASVEFLSKRLDMIKNDISRAALIVSDIISFAKSDKLKVSIANLYDTILKAKDTVVRLYPVLSKNITWEIKVDEEIRFAFNPLKMERVMSNLFRNSLQAFDYKKGKICIECRKTKKWYHIIIEDDAGGIPEPIKGKIFDPFFTNSKTGQGTGLGLSICHSIVSEHNGTISVHSEQNKTRFTISLPANNTGEFQDAYQ